jgi:iron(III) transport system substrate-binding protein
MKRAITCAVAAFMLSTGAYAQNAIPAGYPGDYAQTIENSRAEKSVMVYSNIPESIWAPAIAAFTQKYPWLSVQTLDLGGDLWERYYAESGSGARTADVIVTATIDRWLEFKDKGQIADYASPESAALPDWSRPYPGLYTISTDPVIIAYNKHTVPGGVAPTSTKQLAEMASGNKLKGKLTTYDAAANPFGLAIYWTWIREKKGDWSLFDVIGPNTRPERSAGTMLEKLTTGEYTAALFFSGGLVPQISGSKYKSILGWSFPKDGTPVQMRGMAVTKAATSPNAGRLFNDFMLSREGQIALSKGGLTPYRDDVKKEDVPFQTLGSLRSEVGPENVFLVTYDTELLKNRTAFIDRWKQAFRPE